MAKTDYYLSHESERERIAAAGHEAVANSFTYEQLLPKILRI
jgi:spore maturation protein CgeB